MRRRLELCSAALALATSGLPAAPLLAQAPPSPDRPWSIPESATQRAAQLDQAPSNGTFPKNRSALVALIDLAERPNPQPRGAWEAARAAAAAEGIVESSY